MLIFYTHFLFSFFFKHGKNPVLINFNNQQLTVNEFLGEQFDGGVEVPRQRHKLQVSGRVGSGEGRVAGKGVVVCHHLEILFQLLKVRR